VAGRTRSRGSACGRAHVWAPVCIGPRDYLLACAVFDELPETAAARQRLAGGEVRSAGPTDDRNEGEAQ
jgi:hypothetical protein